jgi:hypothetical protein
VLLADLKPATTYYYRVGDEAHGFSEQLSFTTLGTQWPLRIGIFGDLGAPAVPAAAAVTSGNCCQGLPSAMCCLPSGSWPAGSTTVAVTAAANSLDACLWAWRRAAPECPPLPAYGCCRPVHQLFTDAGATYGQQTRYAYALGAASP